MEDIFPSCNIVSAMHFKTSRYNFLYWQTAFVWGKEFVHHGVT